MKAIVYDNIEMNLISKKVLLNKIEIPLTKKEFDLLRLFMENRNHLFTRKEILSQIWSTEMDISSRTVDVNVMRLRNKIGTYETNIVTRLGYGYSFKE
jgi:two-component system, OmpR family, alkaline phosphatase synthesis response regulator PhoP